MLQAFPADRTSHTATDPAFLSALDSSATRTSTFLQVYWDEIAPKLTHIEVRRQDTPKCLLKHLKQNLFLKILRIDILDILSLTRSVSYIKIECLD